MKNSQVYVLAAGIAVAILGTVTLLALNTDDTQQPAAATRTTAPASPSPIRTTEAPPPPPVEPKPADFTIPLKILSKQCFGSAGCNVTFRIAPAYSGPALPVDKTYRVIYTVSGDESGPQTNSFTLTGEQAEYQSEESASTRSAGVALVAKVTEVLPE